MSKTLFFSIPTHGHVMPSLPVTAELVRRGEEVIYYLTDEYRESVEATGAAYRAYENFPPGLLADVGGNPFILAERMMDACRAMLPGLLDVIRAEQPDYIMHDAMAPWGWQAARAAKLPTAVSMALLAINPKVMLQSPKLLSMMGQMLKSFPLLRQYNRKKAAYERELGVAFPPLMQSLNSSGDLTIVYTSSLFQPAADSFGSGYQFVGPSIDTRPHSSDFPFDQLSDQPLIYISLGTVNNDARAFYESCFKAFGGSAWQVVLSVGKRIPVESLDPVPANFIVRNFVPQLEILQRAALFVTHGGMNSVHEGLYYRVPLVVVPQTIEQSGVAAQVARLGAGVVVDNSQATPERLRAAAERVLGDPSYKRQAEVIAHSFENAGGYKRAADEVLKWARESASGLHARRDAVHS
jgi:MGT family glycosyltransferase